MSVAGKWNITIKAPTGPQATVLELREVDGKLSGAQSGQGMTTEISDATYDGSKIFWINHITKPLKMKVQFTGTVEGKQMSGKVKAGFMGSYAFTGVKE
ncbi:MAG TPA: hypothetical protein VLI06_14705 [Solimonas sp.]|nr:hypothetical protein [Solimonas sp.]